MDPTEELIDTPRGEGRLLTYAADKPAAVLLLSHGAGGGVDAPDLMALAEALPRQGVSVVLFEQPWRRAGRKVATPPTTLDEAFLAAAAALPRTGLPLIVGGRSAGARSAARTALQIGASGCLALSFPLHPPGRPDKSRVAELHGAEVTTLVVQGERDTFGSPAEFPDDVDVCVIPFADHSLKVPKRAPIGQDEAWAIVIEATLEWIVREAAGAAVENEAAGAAVENEAAEAAVENEAAGAAVGNEAAGAAVGNDPR